MEDQNENEPPNSDPVLPEAGNSGSENWQMFNKIKPNFLRHLVKFCK